MQLKKLLTIFAAALGTTLSAAAGAKELKGRPDRSGHP